MKVLTAEQMRFAETETAATAGVSSLTLMENAGSAAAEIIKAEHAVNGKRCVAVCGKGGNGGDAFVVLRKLFEAGADVAAVLVSGKPTNPDAAEMLRRLDELGIRVLTWQKDPPAVSSVIAAADLLIDGIFGIGFHGVPAPDETAVIGCVNSGSAPVYALDLPSGIEADSGLAAGACVRADVTVTFSLPKFAHAHLSSALSCGKVHVVDVGIPQKILDRIPSDVEISDDEFVRSLLPRRAPDAHKGDCGRMLAICGSYTMPGAALMCASAALRSGVGLVSMAIPESVYPMVGGRLFEPTYLPLPCAGNVVNGAEAARKLLPAIKKADSIVFGCGVGNDDAWLPVLAAVFAEAECPVILDADGINLLCRNMYVTENTRAKLILTPHMGEMARLTGLSIAELRQDRIRYAAEAASRFGATVVLKGAHTVIASPDGHIVCNPNGNPGMAVGGSGDVLAGVIGSLAAQGVTPAEAAACAVYLHGAAGDRCVTRLTEYGMTPSDLIAALPEVFREITEKD